jgi:hypothetical protein
LSLSVDAGQDIRLFPERAALHCASAAISRMSGCLGIAARLPSCLLPAHAFAHECVDLPQRLDDLLGRKSLLYHWPTPFSTLNTAFNLAQKEPVTSKHFPRSIHLA